MTVLHYLSYVSGIAAFGFVTLSLASGLLYVSELIEEHSRYAKIIGQRGIYVIIALHILLYFSEALPLTHVAFSVFCHLIYLQNFSATWPVISLTSWNFILSCILVIADHFMWFFYFARITQDARHNRSYLHYSNSHRPPGFAEIATFFGSCVWLIPLFLFLSLSANDNALPVSSSAEMTSPTSASTKQRISLFRSIVPSFRLFSSRRRTSEGIIAPPTPTSPRPDPFNLHTTPSLNNRRASSEHSNLSPPPRSPGGSPRPSFEFAVSPKFQSLRGIGESSVALRRANSSQGLTMHDKSY